jgi:lysophospholipase L1-like esterase
MVTVVVLCAIVAAASAPPALALGQDSYVSTEEGPGRFTLATDGRSAPLYASAEEYPGVIRVLRDLQADIGRVTSVEPLLVTDRAPSAREVVIAGTLGKSSLVDRLVRAKKLDVAGIAGRWEAFLIQVVDQALPGVDRALVIAGSDKRGTIYGIYDLSEQIGVSPWYWWADVPVRRRGSLHVLPGRHTQGSPAVKYRGIFLNDEAPALSGWAHEKFGGFNHAFYEKVFELILRLKGNYLWPAMWGRAFNEDDPRNSELADEYGIVMGTSHHEPMLRAQQEWRKHGTGSWNYATNAAELRKFWRFGSERNKDYESIITIGMRGDGDEPMVKGGDMAANIALLERVVADQREIIAQTVNPDVTSVPQLWALYKEVADYYEHGMRVPDDVTLLWCDDNWGNLRRLPTAAERKRSGGAGVYYHFDYVGSPRSYKWIDTNPLPKVWEQMNLAYRYGVDRIWIVNVGDLKPMELPIEFFLRMAWDPDAIPKEKIAEFTRRWAERAFGPAHAGAIADIVSKYAKYNGWRKPELLEPTTFSLVNYQEADRVLEAWQAVTADAERINAALAPEYRDAFYQLVLYPTKASATVAELHITAGRNRLYARQRRAGTNEQARRVRDLFQQDQDLTAAYHKLGGGKWNRMMSQTHIGFTSWRDPETNIIPEVTELQVPGAASLGVAIEGSELAWPGGAGEPKLPPFDSVNQQRYPIDVFNRGAQPFEFTATTDRPWITLSQSSGAVEKEQRLWVSIDWAAAPVGNARGTVTVLRVGGETVDITLDAVQSAQFTRETLDGAFGGLTGPAAFAAARATSNIAAGEARWEAIPDYGRGISGMTVFPVTTPSMARPEGSPRLEYRVFVPQAGEVQVDVITSPTLDFVPGRGLRLAVSFDDQTPQILDAFANQAFSDPSKRPDATSPPIRDWGKWVKDNARTLNSTHAIGAPGVHTLKIGMVDPGVVLESLVVHRNDVRPSYFGPPEGFSRPSAIARPRNDPNSMLAHQQLVGKAKAGGIDLYFLGDSITRRWGCTDPQYSALLENWKKNFFGWNAANFGWGADRIQNMLWRIENGELDGVNPKVIVILAGTNDVGTTPGGNEKIADILRNFHALIDTCRQKAPEAKLILTAIFPRNDSRAVLPEIRQINDELAKLADGQTLFYLNVNDRLAKPDGTLREGMTLDKLHPTVKGYQVWADGLRPLLTRLLGPPAQTDHAPPPTGDPRAARPHPDS